ncbi:MAG: chorismate mutase [Vampirovibrionia bacterium]
MKENLQLVGIRGATTADSNTPEAIYEASVELVSKLVDINAIDKNQIVHVIFTVSPDITADFPAKAARLGLGWDTVPMICAQEIDVPLEIKHCIRMLITMYTHLDKAKIRHIYLKDAAKLRPDLSIEK